MRKILFLLLFSQNTFAANCESVQVKIIFDRKPVYSKETLCSQKDSDNILFYVSSGCAKGECEILKRKKSTLTIKNYYHNIGSPGFKLCEELGGVPQIFEFLKPKSALWQSTDRCLFNKDFVEISLLTKEWKSYIIKQ